MKTRELLFLSCVFLFGCKAFDTSIIQEPKQNKTDKHISHSSYSLVFNEHTKQANWVSYKLADYHTENNYKRKNYFKPDTTLSIITATNADYKKSGYDRGHLVPAADRTWNEQALSETFYFSNISPQLPSFNRGIWKNLEEQTRQWANEYDSIYICTGPYFENTNNSIGNNVNIPIHFYKTILIYNDTIKQAIGFIFPHSKLESDFYNYSTTIDSLEQILNINFYHLLPNKYEKRIEKNIDINFWK